MNISIPHGWLLEHLTTKADPNSIREYLSLCGPSVERIETIEGEAVYDIEITTNRVDAMSVRGIAREASAILPEFGLPASIKPLDLTKIAKTLKNPSLKSLDLKIINDPKLSHRILAIKLSDVVIGPSPRWLQKRLIQIGQRPLNNAIDITNYVMWELGHPIHAFDYDRLTQKTIIVRVAKSGETLTTLDQKTHTLKGGEVIFDDGTGTIIDLPGIMGTQNTVITKKTQNILLWIESIDAVKIRQTSMRHAIRSQAAILNEKNVDPFLAKPAILRSIELFIDLCHSHPASQLLDIFPHQPKPRPIVLAHAKLTGYLGLDLPSAKVSSILKRLGCQVKTDYSASKKPKSYQVTPPTYRLNDLVIYQDLIEEIARIYGYHRLNSRLMASSIPDHPSADQFDLEYQVKSILSGFGANELYTYSMISRALADISGYALSDHLKIKNPLTDEFVYLRRSMVPSMLEVFDNNPGQAITAFELQNVFHPTIHPSDLPQEQLQLAIITNRSFDHLAGIIEGLLQKLYLPYQILPTDGHQIDYLKNPIGQIKSGTTNLGRLGPLHNPALFAAVFDFASLAKLAKTHPAYLPLISTASIIEDLTFAFPPKTYLGEVINLIKSVSLLIKQVNLTSSYQPKNSSYINHTFTLHYQDPNNSLAVKDIAPIRKKLVKTVTQNYQARLIGNL